MLPNIFWSRTDYISGAYATKMVAISNPAIYDRVICIEMKVGILNAVIKTVYINGK